MSKLNVRPREAFSFDAVNLAASWNKWKEELQLFLALAVPDTALHLKTLLYVGRNELRDVLDSLDLPEDEKTFDNILQKLDEYAKPCKNEVVEGARVFRRNELTGDTFDGFLTDLRQLSLTCAFGNLKDSLIRGRIVLGIADSVVRERLLEKNDLTVESCIELCRASAVAKIQSQDIEAKGSRETNTITAEAVDRVKVSREERRS